MHVEKTRNMMWTFFFLSILSLTISQAAAQGNSTQKYYFKLKIDKNAVGHITQLLRPFVNDINLRVDDLKMTTQCQEVSAGVKCRCKPNHRWSDDICLSNKMCCGYSGCIFPTNSNQMCMFDDSVAVSGSITLGQDYSSCLRASTSEEYKDCNNTLFKEMKTVYSTIRGFDTLSITKYRIGSVIADFAMNIADRVYSNDLIEKTLNLSKNLPATFNLETAGFVRSDMPLNLVCYESSVVLTCQSKEDLGVTPRWNLKRSDRVFDITSGTVADVAILGNGETTLTIREVSELWKGNYTCTYEQQRTGVTIMHKATGILDVSLLPNIYNSTQPPFVRCENKNSVVKVTAQCEISKSSEPYEVTWTGDDISQNSSYESKESVVYTADRILSCDSPVEPAKLQCTFKNRCNQTRSVDTEIYFIKEGDKFCEAEDDWYDTKAGFTAQLKCKDSAGVRQRKCREDGEWEEEDSRCVIQELDNALQQVTIADTGLGFKDENVGEVLSSFENTTNNTENINSFANVNTSVYVLSILDDKVDAINNESSTEHLLESSSNLLESSLNKSWTSPPPEINLTLAETYLSSLERLIEIANITDANRKPNIEVDTCRDEKECKNSVFNANVSLKDWGGGIVKTTGFKQLQSYLPHDDNKKTPNSIVVSTTTNGNTDNVKITIDFPLLTPRPRHVELECVAWNNRTREWSSERCEWAGADDEGRCTCTHLSSFAILLSRHPINVTCATEITFVGLSVSIISLTVSLLIELVVWSDVVKTNTLHLRHTAHVNISVCLLIGNCCFLASTEPRNLSPVCCQTLTVLKHYCYLSMFFWMLCLSTALLHQTLYLFHQVSRTTYLRFSMIVGYGCPLLIVFVTFLTNNSGGESSYYQKDSCWLVYIGLMKGSIFTFVIPVGIIVFVNIFSMLVVIMKLLNHQENMDKSREKEKAAAKTILRTVVLLTPVFGVTWIFGLAVLIVDLTSGAIAFIVNYVFIFLNAFQGLFILLTTCLGDRMTREALLKRFKNKAPTSTSDNTVKLDLTLKK